MDNMINKETVKITIKGTVTGFINGTTDNRAAPQKVNLTVEIPVNDVLSALKELIKK